MKKRTKNWSSRFLLSNNQNTIWSKSWISGVLFYRSFSLRKANCYFHFFDKKNSALTCKVKQTTFNFKVSTTGASFHDKFIN